MSRFSSLLIKSSAKNQAYSCFGALKGDSCSRSIIFNRQAPKNLNAGMDLNHTNIQWVPLEYWTLELAWPCGGMTIAKSCKEGPAANQRRSGLEDHML